MDGYNNRLTKITKIDGGECISCVFFGTPECQIHKGKVEKCSQCFVWGAILNKLYMIEEIMDEKKDEVK